MAKHETAKTEYIVASNGVNFAYRRIGHGHDDHSRIPLLMHIHFRANMDFWDPLLINNLASQRPIILFDQAGVGRSSGVVATTYQGWANNFLALVHALGLRCIDLLGFSMGGYTVQMVALTRPDLIRRLIIAGSGPSTPAQQVPGIVWPREKAPEKAIRLLSTAKADSPAEVEEAITYSFFPETNAGRLAACQYFARIHGRTENSIPDQHEREAPNHSLLSTEKTAEQRKAAQHWYNPTNSGNSFHRLSELKMPVLIVNGDDDVLIPTSHSWELLQGIENAQLIIYPKSGHGFLWQYAEKVARDVNAFLDENLDAVGARL